MCPTFRQYSHGILLSDSHTETKKTKFVLLRGRNTCTLIINVNLQFKSVSLASHFCQLFKKKIFFWFHTIWIIVTFWF